MNDRDATNPGEWEQANSAYLTSALAWLRLRLAWYAQQRPTAAGPEPPQEPSPAPDLQRNRHWFSRDASPAGQSAPRQPAPAGPALQPHQFSVASTLPP